MTDPKKFKLDTINAKGETLLDSNTWRYAFLHNRCLIPVDSFVEWKRIDAKTKLPWMFAKKDAELFALAGVYRHWRSPYRKSEMDTFEIITTEPNELLADKTGHDRMPIIRFSRFERAPFRENRSSDKNSSSSDTNKSQRSCSFIVVVHRIARALLEGREDKTNRQ